MQHLKEHKILVDLQILVNEESTEYNRIINPKWGVGYQLVPPHIHRIITAELAIRTLKAHVLSTVAGIAPTSPKNLWDLIPPQTELTLNLVRQSTLNPKILAWEYFQGPFDYKATPLRTLGYPVMIHRKTSNRKSWDFRGEDGWSIGTALDHYRRQRFIPKDTKAEKISDTVEFRHQTINTPVVTPE